MALEFAPLDGSPQMHACVQSRFNRVCDPMDRSPPGSSVHGILQARTLEWVAMSFSRGSSWPRDRTHVFCISRQFLYHRSTREALWRGTLPPNTTTQHRQQQLKSTELKRQLLIKPIFRRCEEDVNRSLGEGNGHPLQCSCLENPRDGGAWWAAVYGVAQSRTRLK